MNSSTGIPFSTWIFLKAASDICGLGAAVWFWAKTTPGTFDPFKAMAKPIGSATAPMASIRFEEKFMNDPSQLRVRPAKRGKHVSAFANLLFRKTSLYKTCPQRAESVTLKTSEASSPRNHHADVVIGPACGRCAQRVFLESSGIGSCPVRASSSTGLDSPCSANCHIQRRGRLSPCVELAALAISAGLHGGAGGVRGGARGRCRQATISTGFRRHSAFVVTTGVWRGSGAGCRTGAWLLAYHRLRHCHSAGVGFVSRLSLVPGSEVQPSAARSRPLAAARGLSRGGADLDRPWSRDRVHSPASSAHQAAGGHGCRGRHSLSWYRSP